MLHKLKTTVATYMITSTSQVNAHRLLTTVPILWQYHLEPGALFINIVAVDGEYFTVTY